MPKKENKTYISFHSKFEGALKNVDRLVVDGKFEGSKLETKELFVGKTGKVQADLFVDYAVIEGIVIGNITANIRLILMPSAKVLGKLETKELIIQKGVLFEGPCVILNETVTEKTKDYIFGQYAQDE